MRRNTKILIVRRLSFVILILFVNILQNTRGYFPEIFGARAFLLIPLVVCIGMFEREITGAVLGLFAGALWDVFSGLGDGYNTLFLMVIGAMCGLLINLLMRNHLLTALILCTGASVAYVLSYALFFIVAQGLDNAWFLIFRYYLPSCIYTLIFTPLFYIIVRAIMKKTVIIEKY